MGKYKHKSNYYFPTLSTVVDCHIGFTEISKNLFIGSIYDVDYVMDVDILIPLDSVSGDIWGSGFCGEVHYIPIEDFRILPQHIEEREIAYIINELQKGKKIAIFCLGGHGRTGYIASILLYKLNGVLDPIQYLRENYCKDAVESNSQVQRIADVLDNQIIYQKYKTSLISKKYIPLNATDTVIEDRKAESFCYDCDNYFVDTIDEGACGVTGETRNYKDKSCGFPNFVSVYDI